MASDPHALIAAYLAASERLAAEEQRIYSGEKERRIAENWGALAEAIRGVRARLFDMDRRSR